MQILVTGGAGFIGSFMTKRLLDDGYEVIVADSLERGHEEYVDKRATFIKGYLLDKAFVSNLFGNNQISAVIHFAGYIAMAESMQKPGIYFDNNVNASLNMLEEIKDKDIIFIFSSTAGVYGNPIKVPISEDHPKNPTNPYGQSKLMVEQILEWYQKIYGIGFAALRYFNAAGGALDGSMGENHDPETHIIPCAMRAILNDSSFTLYGSDYATPDGTAVRDYIHVLDLVEAHVLALKKLQKEKNGVIYNIGTGTGYSNKEVVDMVKKVTGKDLKITTSDRRPGDAEVLVSDPTRIQHELGFSPKHSDLETIVKSAWEWNKRSPEAGVRSSEK